MDLIEKAKNLLVSDLKEYKVIQIAICLNRLKEDEESYDEATKSLKESIEEIKHLKVLPRNMGHDPLMDESRRKERY